MAAQIAPRPIKRILVANRGEIATRILQTCRELNLETFALYTDHDLAHVYHSHHAIRLSSPEGYMAITTLLEIVRERGIDAVHPGYGFLSESAEFAERMEAVGVRVVGPGGRVLGRTADKVRAKGLAGACGVPVLEGREVVGGVEEVRETVEVVGLPAFVKAVDGGGGRGVRIVREMGEVEGAWRRAIQESGSGSGRVFVERAVVGDGWKHVEVQILGDGTGGVRHFWERECSIQRRFQKVVEVAPSLGGEDRGRGLVGKVIESAVGMARRVRYASLGTFEFLVNFERGEFYFLEVNPRLQVEHTITESICGIDLVKAQLRLAMGATFEEAGVEGLGDDPLRPPGQHSIQLRLTAEDPEKNYSLSIGKIQSFNFPSGAGTRVDTALVPGAPAIITSDFDSVIAKIIITARTWQDAVSKARRALDDTRVTGIQTNLALLRAIVAHPDFQARRCSTQWLESKHEELLTLSRTLHPPTDPFHGLLLKQQPKPSSPNPLPSAIGGAPLLKKNDAWTLTLTPLGTEGEATTAHHHLHLTKLLSNNFPHSLTAEIIHTTPSSSSSKPTPLHLSLTSTTTSAPALLSPHPMGSKANPTHIILPLSGKLVEVLVDPGDKVKKGEAVCVVRQMKMEVEVRTHREGVVAWVTEAEDGEDVGEGMLIVVLAGEDNEEKKVGAAKL